MDKQAVLFALIRSVICGEVVSEEVKTACNSALMEEVYALASKHDLAHLLGQAVSKLSLPESEIITKCKKAAMAAFGRYMRLEHEYQRVCQVLENAQISFIPLKGSVLREYYPEPWMRTSCDVDILVKEEDLEAAANALKESLQYRFTEKSGHDMSFYAPSGVHIELHFDLVEDGRANSANQVLNQVWKDAKTRAGHGYWCEMSDALFYFYHLAHMAKHFETGGCGIRPFIDLWIMDHKMDFCEEERDALLEKGELLRFAEVTRKLSRVWFAGEEADDLSLRLQRYLIHGGVYGSTDNRVALKKKSRLGYVWSRIFAPYEKLKAYYPILEKHRWLMPLMQVRRWFLLLRPDVFKMAKGELAANRALGGDDPNGTQMLLEDVGINTSAW